MDWKRQEEQRNYHPAANLFPLLDGPEFEELKADIAENGLLEAVTLHPDGTVLDGRNRHRACIETGTRPRFKTWGGDGSPVQFVVSKNLHRRHLTSSQRAAVSLDALEMLEAEQPNRQGARTDLTSGNFFPEVERPRDRAATMFQTNPRYVQDARKLGDEAPDLLDEVRSGAKSIPQAKRELTKRQRKEAPPLPTDKYKVIYADPPWRYGNKGLDDYGHAERHYPTMSISELCEFGEKIRDVSASDAVLFLWVPSPMLEVSFQVLNAWGFNYKTSFVWDKVRHNFGYYNSVRHELLLICTRGSCTPDVSKLFDSVQSIERTETHSEKPEAFRDIINTIYTRGKRIELFARRKVDGWDTWGNEPGQHNAS